MIENNNVKQFFEKYLYFGVKKSSSGREIFFSKYFSSSMSASLPRSEFGIREF
jgi:hypothetical protein